MLVLLILYTIYTLIYNLLLQGKINDVRRNSLNGVTGPGFEVQSTPIVLINALGFVGFKLIGVAGTREVREDSLDTMEV